ncbi:MAG: hypothetical protein HEP71_15940 [Roseivirga sp.]|nr:hypothetical protein [Roseivirga sp.]
MDKKMISDHIENWQCCDIAQLVNHFHFMEKDKSGDLQQMRLGALVLEGEALSLLKSDSLKSLTLHMALTKKEAVNGEATFAPILEVCKEGGLEGSATFKPYSSDAPYSGLVPGVFKEAVNRNWLLIDSTLVDDLFLAYKPTEKNQIPQLQRLLRYHISKKTNTLLFDVLTMKGVQDNLKAIDLYMGADMNKLDDKGAFTFTPVIVLRTKKLDDETLLAIAKKGLRSFGGLTDDDDDEVLFEYLKPCPSTCN